SGMMVFWLGGRLTVMTFCVVMVQPSGIVIVTSMLMESLVRLVMFMLLYRKSRLLLAISVSYRILVLYIRLLSSACACRGMNSKTNRQKKAFLPEYKYVCLGIIKWVSPLFACFLPGMCRQQYLQISEY